MPFLRVFSRKQTNHDDWKLTHRDHCRNSWCSQLWGVSCNRKMSSLNRSACGSHRSAIRSNWIVLRDVMTSVNHMLPQMVFSLTCNWCWITNMHSHSHLHKHKHTHIQTHTHTHIYIYIYEYIYVCVCVCVYLRTLPHLLHLISDQFLKGA